MPFIGESKFGSRKTINKKKINKNKTKYKIK